MPVYTYLCSNCGSKFDILAGVNSQKEELKCKNCGSKKIKKTLSSFSVGDSKSNISSGPSCSTGGCCPTCY